MQFRQRTYCAGHCDGYKQREIKGEDAGTQRDSDAHDGTGDGEVVGFEV